MVMEIFLTVTRFSRCRCSCHALHNYPHVVFCERSFRLPLQLSDPPSRAHFKIFSEHILQSRCYVKKQTYSDLCPIVEDQVAIGGLGLRCVDLR